MLALQMRGGRSRAEQRIRFTWKKNANVFFGEFHLNVKKRTICIWISDLDQTHNSQDVIRSQPAVQFGLYFFLTLTVGGKCSRQTARNRGFIDVLKADKLN